MQDLGQEARLEGQQLPGDERQVRRGGSAGAEGQGVWPEVHGMRDACTGGEAGGHQGQSVLTRVWDEGGAGKGVM